MIENAVKPTPSINRREFLFYLWGASAVILTSGACGALAWMMTPRQKISTEGLFTFLPSQIAVPDDSPDIAPTSYAVGNDGLFLSNLNRGLVALDHRCPFRGCLLKWNPLGGPIFSFPHFACPCCGSQFTKNGTWLNGIADRNMDSFVIQVTTPDGAIRTPPGGGTVSIQNATQIVVDINSRIFGKLRPGASPVDQSLYAKHTFGE